MNSVLKEGILPKNEILKRKLSFASFADETVQRYRNKRVITLSNMEKHNLHDLVPLYLTPKTPTLYVRKD